jgi:SAM-dependent methyltransferase
MLDPTNRFSTRVEDYSRYRPGYPEALLPLLEERGTLRPGDTVADLGFGTGKLATRFLQRGYRVYAVEPNAPMREAGRRLVGQDMCEVIDGTAEATGLPDASIGLAAAAQAFHWFEFEPTLGELGRILEPGGRVALIWNVRETGTDSFMAEYEALLARLGADYCSIQAHGIDTVMRTRLFGPGGGRLDRLPNRQRLDRDGLIGRVRSASYMPEPGVAGYREMIESFSDLYRRHERDGQVVIRYRTDIYHGSFAS